MLWASGWRQCCSDHFCYLFWGTTVIIVWTQQQSCDFYLLLSRSLLCSLPAAQAKSWILITSQITGCCRWREQPTMQPTFPVRCMCMYVWSTETTNWERYSHKGSCWCNSFQTSLNSTQINSVWIPSWYTLQFCHGFVTDCHGVHTMLL